MQYLVLGLILTASLSAADFTFGTMLRAGLSGNSDWEMTAGTSATDTSQTLVQVASPYYSNNNWQAFQIGYDGTAGFIRLYNGAVATGNSFTTTSFLRTSTLATNATWTLNSFLIATSNSAGFLKPTTAVELQNLSLGTGLTVLTPLTSTAYSASQTGSGPDALITVAPVSFRSNNAGGAWLLSGQIHFDQLSALPLFGASGSQLQFGLTASAVQPLATPEPATFLMCAGVLIFLGCLGRKRPNA